MNKDANQLHLGHTIRTMRKAAGHSLREMARQIGVSPAYLSGVERGTLPAPTHARLQSLADVLGVPVGYLTALSKRISPDIAEFLERTPEALRFLHQARQSGLTNEDFTTMSTRLRAEELVDWRKLFSASPTNGTSTRLVPLKGLLKKRSVWTQLEAESKEEVLAEMARRMLRGHREVSPEAALERLLAREREASTGLGAGVAIPHATVPGVPASMLGVATLLEPIDFDSIDGAPVRLVFLLLDSEESAKQRIQVLARIAQLCTSSDLLESLDGARSAKKLHSLLQRADVENS